MQRKLGLGKGITPLSRCLRMDDKNIFYFDLSWKSILAISLLSLLPNIAGTVNFSVFGVKTHLFQYFVFIAAMAYGPFGGLVSGGFGSAFSAVTAGNPYIIVGNMLLGFFAGLFLRNGLGIVSAALAAYIIQMPWLYATDVYLAGIRPSAVFGIMASLLVFDVIWALVANFTFKELRKILP